MEDQKTDVLDDIVSGPLNHKIDKKDLVISGSFIAVVLVTGSILLLLGLNDGLYIENLTIRKIFLVITNIGSENINIGIFCLAYLAVDKKFGRRMIVFFGITSYFTSFLKWSFRDPRPPANAYQLNEFPDTGYGETSYGFPSGHTTNSVSVWGYSYLASQDMEKKKRVPLQIIFIALLLLVPYSRLVIGVHDVDDIMGGYTLGIISIITLMILEPKIEKRIQAWNIWTRIFIGMAATIAMWLLGSAILALIHPEDQGRQIEDLALVCGLLMGASIGIPLEEKYVEYHPENLPLKFKALAGIIGLVLTFGIYLGLSALFGLFPEEIYAYTRFVRYTLVTGIVCVLIPLLLKRILVKSN